MFIKIHRKCHTQEVKRSSSNDCPRVDKQDKYISNENKIVLFKRSLAYLFTLYYLSPSIQKQTTIIMTI